MQFLTLYISCNLQLCVLGNLCPETVEEAIAMVPSIKVLLCISSDYAVLLSRPTSLTAVFIKNISCFFLVVTPWEFLVFYPIVLLILQNSVLTFVLQNRGRALDDEAIEKMLNDLSLVKKFE